MRYSKRYCLERSNSRRSSTSFCTASSGSFRSAAIGAFSWTAFPNGVRAYRSFQRWPTKHMQWGRKRGHTRRQHWSITHQASTAVCSWSFVLFGCSQKTWRDFCNHCYATISNSNEKHVVTILSSAVAAQLPHDGQTAYSTFLVVIFLDQDSTCNTLIDFSIDEEFRWSELTISDEIAMAYRYNLGAVDWALCNITRFSLQSGAEAVLLICAFGDLLPVVQSENSIADYRCQLPAFAIIPTFWNFSPLLEYATLFHSTRREGRSHCSSIFVVPSKGEK